MPKPINFYASGKCIDKKANFASLQLAGDGLCVCYCMPSTLGASQLTHPTAHTPFIYILFTAHVRAKECARANVFIQMTRVRLGSERSAHPRGNMRCSYLLMRYTYANTHENTHTHIGCCTALIASYLVRIYAARKASSNTNTEIKLVFRDTFRIKGAHPAMSEDDDTRQRRHIPRYDEPATTRAREIAVTEKRAERRRIGNGLRRGTWDRSTAVVTGNTVITNFGIGARK